MTSPNLPILYQNVMLSLPSQFDCDVFLWATDKFQDDRMAYKAEAFAREADKLVSTIKALLDIRQMTTLKNGGLLMTEEQERDLLRFSQARYANHKIGGNVKSPMPEYL